MTDSDQKYLHVPLGGRAKLAFDWLPAHNERLLDGGCAWGNNAGHFRGKATWVYGVDPNTQVISVARQRYPDIQFAVAGLEATPFDAGFFDAIVINDVLEHTEDDVKALSEMDRILKPGGCLIVTVPHTGLFSFLDTDNYIYYLRRHTPKLYEHLYQWRHKRRPDPAAPGYEHLHRHYSLQTLKDCLDRSTFKDHYAITKIFRSGLVVGALMNNLYLMLGFLIGKSLTGKILKPLAAITILDYWIPYGPLAYDLAVKIEKR